MRSIHVAAVAVALAACGGHVAANDNSQSKTTTQFVLAVSTQGDGAVRGMGNDCRGGCTQRLDSGTKLTLQAAPDTGANFTGWGGACSGMGDCTLTLDGDKTITATFARTARRTLTVLVDGRGSVRSAPGGIDCGNNCTAAFDDGTAVQLTAMPDSGFSFAGWGGACGGAAACTAQMSADVVVRASFNTTPPPPMVHVAVTVTGQGTVTGNGLNCTSACSAAVAPGTPIALTATAASGFRFMGWSGACTGMTCTFNAAADAAVTARFDQEMITLAPADGTNLNAFAINSTSLFFQRYGNFIYGIWSVPKAGGSATLVSSGSCCVMGIVADDKYVIWTDWYGIYRAPVGGGAAQTLFTAYGARNLVLDGNTLYWATQDYWNGNAAVWAGSVDGGPATTLVKASPSGTVAVDSQYVYWTDAHGIGRVPKAGGTADFPIQCGTCQPWVVKVDFDNIYYRNVDGDLWARAKAGITGVKLSAGNPANASVSNVDFDVNAKVAYWTWNEWNNTSTHGLFRANADGSAWASIETAADSTWGEVRVDDNYIYYFHAGALYRRLK